MSTTTAMGLTKPDIGASSAIWGTELNSTIDELDTRLIRQGTAAARPAFGEPGRMYWATDTKVLSFDTGSAWVSATSDASGTAGGDLSGTYPNPQIAAGSIVNADVNAAAAIAESKLTLASDAAAGTASRRSLGATATTAAAGNHTHTAGTFIIPVTFSKTGSLTGGVGALPGRFYVGYTWTVELVQASVTQAPTGATIIVDVNKNATTLFTQPSPDNRPTISVSTFSGKSSTFAVSSLAGGNPGDYLTVDIDQVGSTTAGSNLVVNIWLRGTVS